jgi:hypothetical protein
MFSGKRTAAFKNYKLSLSSLACPVICRGMKLFVCSVLAGVVLISAVAADITVAPIADNRVTIGDARIETINDAVSNDGQRNVYTFTAPLDGRYRFEMAELRSNARVRLLAYNYLDENLADGYCRNGEGLTLDGLTRGQTYEIQVRQYSGLSSYKLVIGYQKETTDVSRLTGLSDSIQYTDQRNVYAFTAPLDGRYRFELAELRSNARVRLMVYNYLDETIAETYCVNGEGLTLNGLVRGQTYTIQVRQYSKLSPYNLIIGQQKATLNINRADSINDSVQYTEQQNTYAFTAPTDGRYRFELAGLRNNARVSLLVYNYLDERIAETYCVNGEGLTLNGLVRGQTYTIYVRQYRGFSPYTLILSQQNR